MKVVIIEDEQLTAEDLVDSLLRLRPNYDVVKVLATLKEARIYFDHKPEVDLIFSDIHLGDGLSFELFASHPPKAPVIFCTAFDKYALEAFKANGIEYILKPFKMESLEDAVEKFERLTAHESGYPVSQLLDLFLPKPQPLLQSSLLVYYKDKIIPMSFDRIALFFIRRNVTYILDLRGKSYVVDKTLEEIDALSLPFLFRANRQCVVNRTFVLEVRQHLARKLLVHLSVPFDEEIFISKERSPAFLKWLEKS